MKHKTKFNTETRVTWKMSTTGANVFGFLIGVSAVILSVALLVAAIRF